MSLVLYVLLSILGTDVLKGDPLGLLDITDEVIVQYVAVKHLIIYRNQVVNLTANNQFKGSFKPY